MTLAEIITPEELASLMSEEEWRFKQGEIIEQEWVKLLTPYIQQALKCCARREHVAGMIRGFALIEKNLRRKSIPVEVIK